MDKWSTIRIETQLLHRLAEHREKTGTPATTVVRMAVERYLDKQAHVTPYWLQQLQKNSNLVDELKTILDLQTQGAAGMIRQLEENADLVNQLKSILEGDNNG